MCEGPAAVRWRDTRNGYGWVSIAAHWFTAIVVLTMWTLGTMSQTDMQDDAAWYAHLHMSIGASAYLLLWARILWRFTFGHPAPHPGQSALLFPVARAFHYLFLIAIGVMLLSGPLMVWSGGDAVEVFAFAIPSPFAPWPGLHDLLRRVHGVTATIIILSVLLHILAALKHIVINRDGTFDKIMIADGAEKGDVLSASKAKA
jgi:cytochrome b561